MAMEIITYLCEFFFTNFWHWAGLVIVLFLVACAIPKALVVIENKKQENCTDTVYNNSNITNKEE